MGADMKNLRQAYCNECEDLVEFNIYDESVEEEFRGEKICYRYKVGKCRNCKSEVATDIDYNSRKSKVKLEAYKRKLKLVTLKDISEILVKYDIGKEALAIVAGFGKVTVKRYYEGFLPSHEYSEILLKILSEEEYFRGLVEEHKNMLKDVTYKKIISRYKRLMEIKDSKIDQIVNYIITHLGEVTPLALEKLLSFSNGVNYALNGERLIYEESQAWQHGPVYPYVYNRYKKYGYKPIDNGIYSSSGCMLSKLTQEEMKAIDLVINTFGLYSPKILEKISHSQQPWVEKRIGYGENEACQEVIDEESIKAFYVGHQLNTEEKIMTYILNCIKYMDKESSIW